MVVRAFLRPALWIFLALIVMLVGVYLAIDIGIVDWAFGIPAGQWLEGIRAAFELQYGVHGDAIDRGLKIVGFSFTIVLGLLGFLSWWVDSEMNLPDRLQRYIDAIKDAHLIDRSVVLAPFVSRNLSGDAEPKPRPGRLERIQRLARADPVSRSADSVLAQAPSWSGQIKVLGAKLAATKCDRITAHLLVASQLVNDAKSLPLGSSEQRSNHARAMVELSEALALDPNEMDALELSATVAKFQNMKPQMQRALDELERVTLNHPLRHSRALRFQAEALEERATKAALNNARVKLERALTILNTAKGDAGEPLERALANEQLGALHLARGTITLVEPYLKDAKTLFEHLPPPEGPAGLNRIKALDERRAAVQRGGDEPEEPGEENDDGTSPALPTHVNSERLAIYKEPAGAIDAGRWLVPYTAVILLSESDEWAQVGKEEVVIGWVALANLHRLN